MIDLYCAFISETNPKAPPSLGSSFQLQYVMNVYLGGTIILVKARPRNGGAMETVYIAADDRAPLWVTQDTCEV